MTDPMTSDPAATLPPGPYMDRDGDVWRVDGGAAFCGDWQESTDVLQRDHGPLTRLVPLPTQEALEEAIHAGGVPGFGVTIADRVLALLTEGQPS